MDDRTREQCGVVNTVHREPEKVATSGGGPGGRFTAWRAWRPRQARVASSPCSRRAAALGQRSRPASLPGSDHIGGGWPKFTTIPAWARTPSMTSSSRTLGLQFKHLHGAPCVSTAKPFSTATISRTPSDRTCRAAGFVEALFDSERLREAWEIFEAPRAAEPMVRRFRKPRLLRPRTVVEDRTGEPR